VPSFVAVFTAGPALALLSPAARRSRWPEQLGVLAGAGALCVLIAALNRYEQGGLDPAPWLGAGALLLAGGIGSYAAARRRLS
jgi:peptidoglycan/LPS O-acetylase OafA/YrhL